MEEKERVFSIELKSRANLKNVTLSNGGHENVLIEGTVGQLRHASFIDGVVLEVVCDKGVLRINLTQDDIKQKQNGKISSDSSKKILVAYMSQTGNTKKVAESIFGAISQKKEIKRVDELQSLEEFNLLFLGFPTHNFGPDKNVMKVLENLVKNRNIALFITHAAPEGGPVVEGWVQKFVDASKEARKIYGVFDCQGELSQQVKNAMLNQPNEDLRRWALSDNSQGQPDETRLENARKFALETVSKFCGGDEV
ncbi:MAG TPA: flavodoxin family protein [Candidatus Binatia bacterium]|nr:flavodoxin family protein [Candidatus Binatia bacterium]